MESELQVDCRIMGPGKATQRKYGLSLGQPLITYTPFSNPNVYLVFPRIRLTDAIRSLGNQALLCQQASVDLVLLNNQVVFLNMDVALVFSNPTMIESLFDVPGYEGI